MKIRLDVQEGLMRPQVTKAYYKSCMDLKLSVLLLFKLSLKYLIFPLKSYNKV